MSRALGRRRALLGLGGAGVALGGGALLGLGAADLRALLRALSPRVTAGWGEVGRRYLAAHGDEADAERLVQLLGLRGWSRGALRAALRARAAEDFAAERTVLVGGWLLSRTEARLAALALLLARG